MRLLFVTNLYPPDAIGGYELRCHDVVAGLRKKGHQITVLTSADESGALETTDGVERALLKPWGKRYDFDAPMGWRQWVKWIRLESAQRRILRRAVARCRPEVISVWNLVGVSPALLTTACRTGLPVAVHIDDEWLLMKDRWFDLWTAYSRSSRGLAKRAFRPLVDRWAPTALPPLNNCHLLFISQFTKERYLQAGYPVANAPVLYSGIDCDLFSAAPAPTEPQLNRPLRLLYAGAMTLKKSPHVALEALAHLAAQGLRDVTLSLAGFELDVSYVQRLKTMTKDLGLGERVHFLGAVPREAMPEIYRTHDLFVFTSAAIKGFSEGLPLAILEAMACGQLVVSSVTGGHGEILHDAVNALLYPAGDSRALAACIQRVMKDWQLGRRIAKSGQLLVRSEFTVRKMIDNNEAWLQSLCRPPGTRSPG